MTSDDLEWHLLPGRREIEPTVREAHRLLISRNPDDEPERQLYLAKLSEMLLAPVAAELEDQRLIIVAEGALLYLPFAALPRPTRPDEAATHGETPKLDESPDYLIRRHEVVYLPSISVLRRLREQRLTHDPPPLQLAIFADPVFTFGGSSENEGRGDGGDADGDLERALEISPTARLEPLPHTREEAEAILRIARGQTMAAFGFEATKAKVLEGRIEEYRILHFATHGLTNREQPELSGLALSLFNEHGERQDGFLRLHEIYNLTLSAELVVLSACQTGLGREVRGEGFHGLMRGFLYAGAARLVASLWSVADRGTAELMKRFYWNLLEAQAPPALALRAAQLAMLEDPKWKHPFYWAGFIFQGEWWPPDEEPPIGTAVGGAVHEDESDRDYPGPDEEWCDSLPEEWMRELCRLLNRLGEPENE
jgi:CHAT domain-containing protein